MARIGMLMLLAASLAAVESHSSSATLVNVLFSRLGLDGPQFQKYANLMSAKLEIYEECFGVSTMTNIYGKMLTAGVTCQRRPLSPLVQLALLQRQQQKPAVRPAVTFNPPMTFEKPAMQYLQYAPYARPSFYYYPRFPPMEYYEYPSVPPHFMVKRDADTAPESSQAAPALPNFDIVNKVGNVSCVLQKMGVVTDDFQLDYNNMKSMISVMNATDGMKSSLTNAVDTCQDISTYVAGKLQGVPPLHRMLAQPMAFLKCFSGKKVTACLKQDVHDAFRPTQTADPAPVDPSAAPVDPSAAPVDPSEAPSTRSAGVDPLLQLLLQTSDLF